MTTVKTRTHIVVGEHDQVAAAMDRARTTGRLVAVHSVQEFPGRQVRVIAGLREPHRFPRLRPWLVGLGVLLGTAAVAGLIWLTVLAVMSLVAAVTALVAWVYAHLAAIIAGAGVLLLLALICAGGGASCSGLHCGGCRR